MLGTSYWRIVAQNIAFAGTCQHKFVGKSWKNTIIAEAKKLKCIIVIQGGRRILFTCTQIEDHLSNLQSERGLTKEGQFRALFKRRYTKIMRWISLLKQLYAPNMCGN